MSAMRIATLSALVLLAACQSPPPEEEGKKLTAGVVQREIRAGMSGAEVIEALGSPNIVTGDESGNEVWTYERYAREVETKQTGWWVIFAWGDKERAKGSTRSFTVIVKFDAAKKVREFAYHVVTF
jgi:outer membrane protein assembly factor BamE (lipoprotein component of BamABCDE complex)